MTPSVPTTVWEQIPVIVIFAFLLAGIGYFAFKSFTASVTEINKNYAQIVEKNNAQFSATLKDNNLLWQKYIDARAENTQLVNEQFMKQLAALTEAVRDLSNDFNLHDQMERQALDTLKEKRIQAKQNRNSS